VTHHGGEGRIPSITFADYNQVFQVCLQPAAHGADRADEVVILWRIEDLFERDLLLAVEGDQEAEARIVAGAEQLAEAIAGLAQQVSGQIVASDAPIPVGYGLDHDDDELVVRLTALQSTVNGVVDARLAGMPLSRLRLSAMQAVHGVHATFDRRTWLMYRQPFTDEFANLIGSRVAEVIAARTWVPPKVLLLDCDNTLWGGVAADDGLGLLECSEAFPGFAYRSFQLAARRLRHRGVLLALTSKNEEETVVEVFDQLDGMALAPADIATRRVNWDPKPGNIESIAEELNLGLDSFVFVDDADHELGAVAAQLPAVRLLRVPDDIEALPDLLSESGLFRLMRVTVDDQERTERIVAAAARTRAASAMSHDEFLASLGLRVAMVAVTAGNLGRVSQLINKTNQFNLTTRRRSEADVERLVADPGVVARAIEVNDAFGEYGLVGVAVARLRDGTAELDTLLMSCRVLGRGVETTFLALLTEQLRDQGAGDVVGRFIATRKNALVADLYPNHGFVDTAEDGVWVLPGGTAVAVPSHVTAVTA
ncbi:MAG: HAD-IIIC family phosphatase, partial [Actinomycetota bacterium]|nr:HAD-IIIC family phosphatase [Actinomycetota bacterium]